MDDFGTISSIESLPLPEGPHVKDFDAAQAAEKKAARAAKKAIVSGAPDQAIAATSIPAAPEPGTAKPSQALESNASGSGALAPDTAVSGEYVGPPKLASRKVEPISRVILSDPGTTMGRLHEMGKSELSVLDALDNEGRQIIKTRLMAIWEEMSVRFERGESVNGISGTGGKGMGKYLRSIGIKPAKRRSWKFEIRREEMLRLAQENPPVKRTRPGKKEIVISSGTEADLIAKAGVRLTDTLLGTGSSALGPLAERVKKAVIQAKSIEEAIAGGDYDRVKSPAKPLPDAKTPKALFNFLNSEYIDVLDAVFDPEGEPAEFARKLEAFANEIAAAFHGTKVRVKVEVVAHSKEKQPRKVAKTAPSAAEHGGAA